MWDRRAALWVLASVMPAACARTVPVAPAMVPALIVDPDAAGAAELEARVRDALSGTPVVLAADALTASNVLTLEHTLARDAAGLTVNGRDLSRPETFALFERDSTCVLFHPRTGRSWTLHATHCAPAPRDACGAACADSR